MNLCVCGRPARTATGKKECQRCRDKARYRKPEEKARSSRYKKQWAKNNPEKVFASNLRRYGVTPEEFFALEEYQKGVCAICGDKPKRAYLDVDHDHTHGFIRGLLCSPCNTGIGLFRDNPEILTKAIKYLQESTCAAE